MEPRSYFDRLRNGLEGHTISMTRLAANSLLIYVECEPGDKQGVTIWFEPAWHFAGPGGVLVGSRQAQMDDEPDDTEAFYRVAEPLRVLEGKLIESVIIEPIMHDLQVRVDDGYWIKTFASDPNDDESWYIKHNASGRFLKGFPKGLAVESRDTEQIVEPEFE
jgi:hypothetical protein